MNNIIRVLSGLSVVFLLSLGGCPPSDDNGTDGTDGQNGNGDMDDGTGGGNDLTCGERTVTNAPPAGYLECVATMELTVDPPESPLAKVVFGAAPCTATGEPDTDPGPIYQVDAAGNVVAIITLMEGGLGDRYFFSAAVTDRRLEVTDGCLVSEVTGGEADDEDDDDLDPTDPPTGPCGPGRFTITRQGVTSDDVEGPYICVAAYPISACRDCWYEDGVWYDRIVTTGYYVAEGSLDGVSIDDWALVCDPESVGTTVNIQAGNRVDFTWTIITEYRESPSPQELGYQEVVLAP